MVIWRWGLQLHRIAQWVRWSVTKVSLGVGRLCFSQALSFKEWLVWARTLCPQLALCWWSMPGPIVDTLFWPTMSRPIMDTLFWSCAGNPYLGQLWTHCSGPAVDTLFWPWAGEPCLGQLWTHCAGPSLGQHSVALYSWPMHGSCMSQLLANRSGARLGW